jgi:hypothetical protein
MKYLLVYLILSSTICTYAQTVSDTIDKHDTPTIIEDESVYLKGEIWVETVEDEIKQRHKINVLTKNLGIARRKLDKINTLLKKKRRNELATDSLIYQISSISRERDSLLAIVETEIGLARKKLLAEIHKLEGRIDFVYGKYIESANEKRKIKRHLFLSIAGNVILVAILVVAI